MLLRWFSKNTVHFGERGSHLRPDDGSCIMRYKIAAKQCAGKRVLDIGCGTGLGASLISQTATQLIGIDYSSATIAYAKRHNRLDNVEYYVADIQKEIVEVGTFDLVCMFEVLEHVQNARLAMHNVTEKMKPDAVLLLSTPNVGIRGGKHESLYHEHEYTYAELSTFLRSLFREVKIIGIAPVANNQTDQNWEREKGKNFLTKVAASLARLHLVKVLYQLIPPRLIETILRVKLPVSKESDWRLVETTQEIEKAPHLMAIVSGAIQTQ